MSTIALSHTTTYSGMYTCSLFFGFVAFSPYLYVRMLSFLCYTTSLVNKDLYITIKRLPDISPVILNFDYEANYASASDVSATGDHLCAF